MIEAKRGGGGSLLVKGIIIFQKSLLTAEVCVFIPPLPEGGGGYTVLPLSGFSKRIEVEVSIYKVGGELSAGGTNRAPQAQVGESPRGGVSPLSGRRGVRKILKFSIVGDAF
jgi:hypothetical protein